MKNKKTLILGISLIIAMTGGFILGQFVFDKQEEALAPIRAMVPETPRKLAFPALQQGDGSSLDMASLQGKWSLLFFGYMNCPDICPTTLGTLAQVKQDYINQGLNQDGKQFPQVIFISIDPERDDIKSLAEYVSYFDKSFIAATGEEKLLQAIVVQMDSKFIVEPSENEREYAVGHSLNLVLINPNVELTAILRPPHTVQSILRALDHFQ